VSCVRNGHCATRTSEVPKPRRMNCLARPSGITNIFCSAVLGGGYRQLLLPPGLYSVALRTPLKIVSRCPILMRA
jgi:hypothetical protein